jgi:hypothetical protein
VAKFLPIQTNDGSEEWSFFCPGCQYAHWVRVKGERPCWTWNGDAERPTVSPSLFVDPNGARKCHSFIRDGKIEFLSDCHHALRGQTVEIPDWEA